MQVDYASRYFCVPRGIAHMGLCVFVCCVVVNSAVWVVGYTTMAALTAHTQSHHRGAAWQHGDLLRFPRPQPPFLPMGGLQHSLQHKHHHHNLNPQHSATAAILAAQQQQHNHAASTAATFAAAAVAASNSGKNPAVPNGANNTTTNYPHPTNSTNNTNRTILQPNNNTTSLQLAGIPTSNAASAPNVGPTVFTPGSHPKNTLPAANSLLLPNSLQQNPELQQNSSILTIPGSIPNPQAGNFARPAATQQPFLGPYPNELTKTLVNPINPLTCFTSNNPGFNNPHLGRKFLPTGQNPQLLSHLQHNLQNQQNHLNFQREIQNQLQNRQHQIGNSFLRSALGNLNFNLSQQQLISNHFGANQALNQFNPRHLNPLATSALLRQNLPTSSINPHPPSTSIQPSNNPVPNTSFGLQTLLNSQKFQNLSAITETSGDGKNISENEKSHNSGAIEISEENEKSESNSRDSSVSKSAIPPLISQVDLKRRASSPLSGSIVAKQPAIKVESPELSPQRDQPAEISRIVQHIEPNPNLFLQSAGTANPFSAAFAQNCILPRLGAPSGLFRPNPSYFARLPNQLSPPSQIVPTSVLPRIPQLPTRPGRNCSPSDLF